MSTEKSKHGGQSVAIASVHTTPTPAVNNKPVKAIMSDWESSRKHLCQYPKEQVRVIVQKSSGEQYEMTRKKGTRSKRKPELGHVPVTPPRDMMRHAISTDVAESPTSIQEFSPEQSTLDFRMSTNITPITPIIANRYVGSMESLQIPCESCSNLECSLQVLQEENEILSEQIADLQQNRAMSDQRIIQLEYQNSQLQKEIHTLRWHEKKRVEAMKRLENAIVKSPISDPSYQAKILESVRGAKTRRESRSKAVEKLDQAVQGLSEKISMFSSIISRPNGVTPSSELSTEG